MLKVMRLQGLVGDLADVESIVALKDLLGKGLVHRIWIAARMARVLIHQTVLDICLILRLPGLMKRMRF